METLLSLYRLGNGELENAQSVSGLIKYVNNSTNLKEFDADAFEAHIDYINVYNRSEIGFALKCGVTLKERL